MKIVLDIETLAIPRPIWQERAERPDPVSLSDEQQAEEQDAYEQAQFTGAFCRIICVGALLIPDHQAPQAIAWYGDDERTLLTDFWAAMAGQPSIQYITHNGFNFDFPVLWQRSIIHGVKPTKFPSLSRYRMDAIYDTLEIWSQWNTRHRIKLNTLAKTLDVPTKSGSGQDVGPQWLQGDQRAVAEYCLQDLVVTYACYSKMAFQPFHNPATLLDTPTFHTYPVTPSVPIL